MFKRNLLLFSYPVSSIALSRSPSIPPDTVFISGLVQLASATLFANTDEFKSPLSSLVVSNKNI